MCTVQGFPLVALPGGNVFFSDHDASSGDGFITCKQISAPRAAYSIVKALKYLVRLVPEL